MDISDGTKDYEEFLDQNVTVVMKDGKYISGILRSFDQFCNVTIENGIERIIYKLEYSEKNVGLYVIRGENVVLICKSGGNLKNYKKISYEEIKLKLDELTV